MKERVQNWPTDPQRVQLAMAKKGAFFPIEFLYDGETAKYGSKLCDQMADCLKEGKEKENCPIRASKSQICPMGFWSLKRVIERRAWDGSLSVPMQLQLSEGPRTKIGSLESILFGAAKQADAFKQELTPEEAVKFEDTATAAQTLGVPIVKKWDDWQDKVANEDPRMLLLVVHFANKVVFIGDGDGLGLAQCKAMAGGSGSLLVALGCNTAACDADEFSLPSVLQIYGVRLFVGALTTILGRHTNKIARRIAEILRAASTCPNAITIGDLLLKLRQELFSELNPLSLVITTFGDANVRVGGSD
jgi:hypothetical protein